MKRVKTVQTPNLDKMLAKKDEAAALQTFIDWYCDEYLPNRIPPHDELTIHSHEHERQNIMAAFYGIDLDAAEHERMALLTDIRQDYKAQDAIKRKQATR
jgi:hypothetical protein